MTRRWVATFADPAVLEALRSAVHDMAGELDDCDPEECMHPEQRVHPQEVFDWIERAVHIEKSRHVRPAGQPNRRREGEKRMPLLVAG